MLLFNSNDGTLPCETGYMNTFESLKARDNAAI